MFSEWFNKITECNNVNDLSYVNDTITDINTNINGDIKDNTTKHKKNYDAYEEYMSIKRQLHIKKTQDQINQYDNTKSSESSDYKSFSQNCENEVDEKDINDKLDNDLDIIQKKKLNIYKDEDEPILSEKELNEKLELIRKKDEQDKLRTEERMASIQTLNNHLDNYDAKQMNRVNYKTYKEICTYEKDIEMDIMLMEKLGIYDESTETDEQKKRRLKNIKIIEERLMNHYKKPNKKL